MTTVPISHITDAQQLSADGRVQLFQIDLYGGGSLYLKADHTETWNGTIWEGIGLKLTGEGSYGNEQTARPKLMVQNPDGAFSLFVSEGALSGALVTRYTVLQSDLEQNAPIYVSQVWQVGRVSALNRFSITLDLRGLADTPNFVIPANTFSPPKFPLVSIATS